MDAFQVAGTWVQLGGVLVAFLGLLITYRRYAASGTLWRAIKGVFWRAAQRINPKWRRNPRVRFSGFSAWGAEVDTRNYELPSDTGEALRLLATFISEDRATLLQTKAESGHALHELQKTDTRQRDAVEAGVRDYALSGLALAGFGLVVTAFGIALTLI